jgi:GH15 family glucan-1,4-alpha-glucosidase
VLIEDYGLIGDLESAALGRNRAIDWLCLPRFDSASCFSALRVVDFMPRRGQRPTAVDAEVCERGYDPDRRTFTQYYGSKELDASVLNIPLVGFLPGDDERVTGTIDEVWKELGRDGFVSRFSTAETDDGLPGDEGQFLACSFWLVNALARDGRVSEARKLFERLIDLANDLGLLAEEYDVTHGRQVGNFPQAFSHLTLILAARAISTAEAKAEHAAA